MMDDEEPVAPDTRSEDEMALDAPDLAAAAKEPRSERPVRETVDDPNAPHHLVSLEDNIDGLVQILEGARKDLAVFSWKLDHRLYDNDRVMDLLRQLATSSVHAKLRFLIMDSKMAVAKGSRVINLGRSLSSFFEFRKVHSDFEAMGCEFVVVDEIACLYRSQADSYQGLLYPHSGLEGRMKLRLFDKIWDKSEPDQDLRQMQI
jgi:hypothetical protein